ncbi:unnamed protein product [Dovyalis caffra]|uniref:Uncharacterized protein n=1 Tax=Dovyalis caffra TaxID=77055 RepID=A0AAV1QSP7_9ROSI|nr:unnamed protein product [Dovyalis caffra]
MLPIPSPVECTVASALLLLSNTTPLSPPPLIEKVEGGEKGSRWATKWIWKAVAVAEEAGGENLRYHILPSSPLTPDTSLSLTDSSHEKEREKERALKCYQRAVSLSPDDSESGDAIYEILDHSGKETLQLSLCSEASQKSPRAFWAFRRLGYLHLHHNRCSEVVQTLQHAIRDFPTSPDSWQIFLDRSSLKSEPDGVSIWVALKRVGVRIKVVSSTLGSVVMAKARQNEANWVVLDKKLKQELKHCIEELRCNITVMKGSQAKVLRLNLGCSNEVQAPFYSAAASPEKDVGRLLGHKMKHSTPVRSSPEEPSTSYSRTREGSSSPSYDTERPLFLGCSK